MVNEIYKGTAYNGHRRVGHNRVRLHLRFQSPRSRHFMRIECREQAISLTVDDSRRTPFLVEKIVLASFGDKGGLPAYHGRNGLIRSLVSP